MLALELFESTREGYREEFREAWTKKNGNGKGSEGDREFRAMQRERQLRKRGHDV
jgi:hypothetical protein